MHPEALTSMEKLLERAPIEARLLLDVGSLDINGSYRPMVEKRGWEYRGIDIRPGKNVDIVVQPYFFGNWVSENEFDIVISGSTMEHVERPWLWLKECARVLKPGGLLAIVTHWNYPLHEHPFDCFRFMPHGMEVLFDDTGVLTDYEIYIANSTDIVGSAFKK